MFNSTETRHCLLCNKPLRGRADKKFCDDYCRNAFNNKLKAPSNRYVRNINNALSKNRRILETLLKGSGEMIKINKEKLLGLGFQFQYITHTHTTRTGKTYFYCYDYGWLPLENKWVLIVKKNEKQVV